ncbi:MAG: CtsR family transcriptional regulator [Peptococcia bacterium]|jgi:transcriptional regulator CtsR
MSPEKQELRGEEMSLVRQIEGYLKELLGNRDYIEVQRNELAEIFNCVPSQINYVLSTRFTPAHGYLVESRRGGGGYVRIVKLSWNVFPQHFFKELSENLKIGIDQHDAEGILKRFYEEELITGREYNILNMIINRDTLTLDLPERDYIRARIMHALFVALCREDFRD